MDRGDSRRSFCFFCLCLSRERGGAVNQGLILRASVTNRQRISVRLRQNILTPIRWICFWMLRSSLPSASQNSRFSVLPLRRSFAISLWVGESVYSPQRISNCRFEITICSASTAKITRICCVLCPARPRVAALAAISVPALKGILRVSLFVRPGKKKITDPTCSPQDARQEKITSGIVCLIGPKLSPSCA